jgi:hypothetical protein
MGRHKMRMPCKLVLYLVPELWYDEFALINFLLDAVDKSRHIGDRPVNDHCYLFLKNGIKAHQEKFLLYNKFYIKCYEITGLELG